MMTNRPRWVNRLFKRYLHAFHIRLSTHDWCCNRERCKYPCGLTAGYGWSSNDWPTADLWRSFRNIEARLSKQNNLTMPTWHSAVIFWKWITHWGGDKMAAISQTTVSSAFLLTKTFEWQINFYWNVFLMVQLITWQHWFRKCFGTEWATSHYLNQYWYDLQTHVCVTRPQWVTWLLPTQYST